MEEGQITYIGKVDHRNKLTKFGIKPKDRTKHMYVVGKTGTGKSTFLENMIAQDIANGNGFAFIDPHGGSVDKLLDYIPEWRMNDVIYLNPADTDFPVAFNPLEDVGPEKRHLVADGLMSVFEKIWPEAFSGRMTYILNNTMLALLESPDSSLLGINRMLTDKDYRKRIVANVTDPAVRNAWDELMKWDDKTWRDAVAALVNKVGQFTTNPIVRNIIGQTKSTFDFRRAMDERKIILINLSKGMIGEQNAPLIGAMLITKIYLAAMSRAEYSNQVIEKLAPFYFYVDEFQNFANESFASILSEARKYKLALVVANQYIAQMEETIRDAVFGNMGTTVSFRVGPLDAEFIEKVFAPVFTQEDLQNVMFGQYYITLQIDGMGSKPFSAQGLPPIPPLQTSMRAAVIEASRKQFARPKIEVDAAVREWFGFSRPEGAKADETKRVIRPDIGNDTGGARGPKDTWQKPAGAPTPKPAAAAPVKKFDPAIIDAPATKPVAPIVGYQKKEAVTTPVTKPSMPRSTPATTESLDLASMLDKLDDAVLPTPTKQAVRPVEPRPVLVDPGIVTPQERQPVVEPISVHDAAPAPVTPTPGIAQKPLTRAATPEKKSALAEALAKAMGDAKAESKIDKTENIQGTAPASVDTVESAPAPRLEVPPVPRAQPVVSQSTQPVSQPSMYHSSTPREVPEDILRQVLE